jgi:DNA-binding MarR family transcriptional regulator
MKQKSAPRPQAKPRFDHQGYVPYLLRRIADTLIARFTEGLEPHGITLPMWRVLAVLHRRGPTRFGVLARQTLIEPPTLTRLVGALADKGFVIKTLSDVDARGVLIAPTQIGLDVVERVTPHALAVEQETLAGLTEDEAELFRRLVKRVCGNLAPFAPDDEGRD